MGELYDNDVLEWSERQAELLRQHAAGRTSDSAIDWPNIIEEVESVGRSQLTAMQSLLVPPHCPVMLDELLGDGS